MLQRVVGRMQSRLVAMAFDAWHQKVLSDLSRRAQLQLHAVNRMIARAIAMAFQRWSTQIAWHKAIVQRARQLAARMLCVDMYGHA